MVEMLLGERQVITCAGAEVDRADDVVLPHETTEVIQSRTITTLEIILDNNT